MYTQVELFEMAYGLTLKMTPAFMELKGVLWDYEGDGIKFLVPEYQARHENPETRSALYQELNAYFFLRKPLKQPENKRTISWP
jgi:hypothetical protein